jgi:alpha-methylacyl-CoA racemase
VTPVLSLAEAPAHAHALARQAYVEVDGLLQPAPAPRFSRSVPAAPGPAPEIGADGAAVLHDAGLNAAEIEGLRAAGVLR